MFLTPTANCLSHTLLRTQGCKSPHRSLSAAPGYTSLKFGLYASEVVPHIARMGKITGWRGPQHSPCQIDFAIMLSGALRLGHRPQSRFVEKFERARVSHFAQAPSRLLQSRILGA